MPRNVGSDLDISVTATSPFSPRRQKEIEKSLPQETLKQDVPRGEILTQTDVKYADKPMIKLPVLARPRRVNKEESNNLQVILRGIQCFDFSLDRMIPELNTPRKDLSQSSELAQGLEVSLDSRELSSQEGKSLVYDQNHRENTNGEKDNLKEKDNALPLTTSILEGQRLNIREKEGFNTKRGKQLHYKPRAKENKLSYQTDLTSEDSDIEDTSSKSIETRRTSSNVVSSVKPGKQVARPVFHLPKADKYDITPRNIINSKVCSVFKVCRKSSLFKSGYKESWIPRRDSHIIKNSVFKTIMQQQVMFLRQPSPVAGVKMTLKEQQDSLVAATQAVEETNARPQSVDDELTRQVKKFVIRLPPIC